MPAKRRSYRDPAPRKRARKTPKLRIQRYPRSQVLTTQRKFWLEHWAPNTTTTAGFWRYYQFTPNLIPNWNDFFNLFDQYKINALKFSFVPRFDNYAGNDSTDVTAPGVTLATGAFLHVVNDPYSTVTPSGTYTTANLNSFMEQGPVKTYVATKPVEVYYKPTINMATEAGNNMRTKAPWLNVNLNNAHSGFHIFAQDPNLSAAWTQTFDVFVTVYASFRNMR